jgi:hypothetical protein
VTITKSITIDGHEVFGSVLVSGTNGIVIQSDNSAAPTVRLRNLNVTGITGQGLNGIRIIGATTSNAVVVLENMMIDGFSQRGISDERSGGGKLLINDTTIRNNGGAGIGMFPTSGAPRIDAVLNRVYCINNTVGAGFGGPAVAMIVNSVFSLNTNSGIEMDGPSPVVNIDQSTISGNGTGIAVFGGIVRLSNTNIMFNTAGISGATQSFTNNRIAGNDSAGTAPTPIGGPTNPTGQQ